MSIQNYLLSFFLKSQTNHSLKLSPEHRFKRSRKLLSKDFSKKSSHSTTQKSTVSDVQVEWIIPNGITHNSQVPVCLYLHGGAFIMGGMNSHRGLGSFLAEKAQIRVLMVDYRLAPEFPYPAAIDDVMSVYSQLLTEGYSPNRIYFGGDSAGGNLIVATLLRLQSNNTPLPKAFFLFSPWLDLHNNGQTIYSNTNSDVMLKEQFLNEAVALYAPNHSLSSPDISPIFGEFKNFPPSLIIASESEILFSDSKTLHQKLINFGCASELKTWAKTPHAFPVLVRILPEAKEALVKTAIFLRSFNTTSNSIT